MGGKQLRTRKQSGTERASRFKPTTDLHFHMDAMSPRAIHEVSKRFDLPWSGKSLDEIKGLASVKPGVSWKEWYKAHSNARAAVFVKPEVFCAVAKEVIVDSELEGLDVRVLRFSLTMPEYCFKAKYGRKPDFSKKEDRSEFLTMFDQVMDNLVRGVASYKGKIKTPLIFSISSQDIFIPLLMQITNVLLNHRRAIAGLDITNEQVHRLATEYREVVERIRNRGIEALTVHTGEQEPKDGEEGYHADERIKAALALNPDTLGHAIYAVNYPGLINAIGDSRVVVELCPSSNLYLNQDYVNEVLGGDLRRYPLEHFKESGIPVTINSDVPGSIESSLQNEFEIARKIFGLSEFELRRIDSTARQAAHRIYGV
jgi:adenosine deaminase